MKDKSMLKSIWILLAVVMCLQIAAPSMVLAKEMVDTLEGKEIPTEKVGDSHAGDLSVFGEVKAGELIDKEVRFNINLNINDPNLELKNGKIIFYLDKNKEMANILDYTKVANLSKFVQSVNFNEKEKIIEYILKDSIRSGDNLTFFIKSGLSADARAGEEFNLSVKFQADGYEKILTSNSVKIPDSSLTGYVELGDNSWSFSGRDNGGEESTKLYIGSRVETYSSWRSRQDKSFKNMKIVYEFNNKLARDSIGFIGRYPQTSPGESSVNPNVDIKEFDIQYSTKSRNGERVRSKASVEYTDGTTDGNTIVTNEFGDMDGFNIDYFALFSEINVSKEASVGDVLLGNMKIYENDKLYYEYTFKVEVIDSKDEINVDLSISTIGKNKPFSVQLLNTYRRGSSEDWSKEFVAKVSIPSGLVIDKIHAGVPTTTMKGASWTETIELIYEDDSIKKFEVNKKLESGKWYSYNPDFNLELDDGKNIKQVKFKFWDGGDFRFRSSPSIMFKELKPEMIDEEIKMSYTSKVRNKNIEEHKTKQIKTSEIKPEAEYFFNKLGYTNTFEPDKIYTIGDQVKYKLSAGVSKGGLKDPYLFVLLPKGMFLKEESSVIQKPYNNMLSYGSIPWLGKFNKYIKMSDRIEVNDAYDLYLQRPGDDNLLTSLGGIDIIHSNKFIELNEITSGKHDLYFGFGFNDNNEFDIKRNKLGGNVIGYEMLEADREKMLEQTGLIGVLQKKIPGFDSRKIFTNKRVLEVEDSNIVSPSMNYRKAGTSKWINPGKERVDIIPGELVEYKVEVENLGTNILKNFELINIFPHKDDKLSNDSPRGSDFNLNMYDGDDKQYSVKVSHKTSSGERPLTLSPKYTDSKSPSSFKFEQVGNSMNVVDVIRDDWKSLVDKTDIKGLNLLVNEEIKPGEKIIVEYTLKVPIDAKRPINNEDVSAKNNIIYRYTIGEDKKYYGAELPVVNVYTKKAEKNAEVGGLIYTQKEENDILKKEATSGIKLELYKESSEKKYEKILETYSGKQSEGSDVNFGFKELDYGKYKVKLVLSEEAAEKYYINKSILDTEGYIKYKDGVSEIEVSDAVGKFKVIDDLDIRLYEKTNLFIQLQLLMNIVDKEQVVITDTFNKHLKNLTLYEIGKEEPLEVIEVTDENKDGKVKFSKVSNIKEKTEYEIEINFKKDSLYETRPKLEGNRIKVNLEPGESKTEIIKYTDTEKPSIEIKREKSKSKVGYDKVELLAYDEGTKLTELNYTINDGSSITIRLDDFNGKLDLTDLINSEIEKLSDEDSLEIRAVGKDLVGNITDEKETLDFERKNKIEVATKFYKYEKTRILEDIINQIKSEIIVSTGFDKSNILIDTSYIPNDLNELEAREYDIFLKDVSEVEEYLKAKPVTVKIKVIPEVKIEPNKFTVTDSDKTKLEADVNSAIKTFPAKLVTTINYETGLIDHIAKNHDSRATKTFTGNTVKYKDENGGEKTLGFEVKVEGSRTEDGKYSVSAEDIKVKPGASFSKLNLTNAIDLKVKVNGADENPLVLNDVVFRNIVENGFGDITSYPLVFTADDKLNVTHSKVLGKGVSDNFTIKVTEDPKYANYEISAKDKEVYAGSYTKENLARIIELKLKVDGVEKDYNLSDVKFYEGTKEVRDFETLLSTVGDKNLEISYEPEGVKGIVTSVKVRVLENETDPDGNKENRLEAKDIKVAKDLVKTRAELLNKIELTLKEKDKADRVITEVAGVNFYDGKAGLNTLTDAEIKTIFAEAQTGKELVVTYEKDNKVLTASFKVNVEGSTSPDGQNAIEAKDISVKEGASLSRLQFANAIELKIKENGNYIEPEIAKMILKAVENGVIGNPISENPLVFNAEKDINVGYTELQDLSKNVNIKVTPNQKYKNYEISAKDKEVYAGAYTKEDLVRIIELTLKVDGKKEDYDLSDVKFYEGTKEIRNFETLLATAGDKNLEISYEPEGVKGIVTSVKVRVLENETDPDGNKENRLEAENFAANKGAVTDKEKLIEKINLKLFVDKFDTNINKDKVVFYDGLKILDTDEKIADIFNQVFVDREFAVIYDYELDGKTTRLIDRFSATIKPSEFQADIYAESFDIKKDDYKSGLSFDDFKNLSKLKVSIKESGKDTWEDYKYNKNEFAFSINLVEKFSADLVDLSAKKLEAQVLLEELEALNKELVDLGKEEVQIDLVEVKDISLYGALGEIGAKNSMKDNIAKLSAEELDNLIKDLKEKIEEVKKLIEEARAEEIKDEEIKDEEIKDEEVKDQEIKDQEVKDEEVKDEEAKDQEAKDEEAKDQEVKDEEVKDEEVKDQEVKDQEVKDQEVKDEEVKDEEAKDEEAKDEEAKDEEVKDEEAKDQEVKDQETAYRVKQAVSIARLGHPLNMLVAMGDTSTTPMDFEELAAKLLGLEPGRYELDIKHQAFGIATRITVIVNNDGSIEIENLYDISIENRHISLKKGVAYNIQGYLPIYGNNGMKMKLKDKTGDIDLNVLKDKIEANELKFEIKMLIDGNEYIANSTNNTEINSALARLSVGSHTGGIEITIRDAKNIILDNLQDKLFITVRAEDTKPPVKPDEGSGNGGSGGGGSNSGGSGGGGSTTGGSNSKDPVKVLDPIVEYELDKVNHMAYLTGYKDGTVRPNGNLTREEAAMVFYRLLDSQFKNAITTKTHSFTDVSSGRWSEEAIASLTKAGMLNGYKDGTFKPNNQITRAELATIIAKLSDAKAIDSKFTDIANHWAKSYISTVEANGWINGYKDGTFKPNNQITRAEFAAIVNRYLERNTEVENMLPGVKVFKDLEAGKWYYGHMLEATNGHKYEMKNDKEIWTELLK